VASGIRLGRPWAHVKGKLHFDRLNTSELHCAVLKVSLNMIADRHARELIISMRAGGMVANLLTQSEVSIGSFCSNVEPKSDEYAQAIDRRRSIRTGGFVLQRSAILGGRCVT